MTGALDWVTGFDALQRMLWLVAVLFYGVGDTVTTAVGLRAPNTSEVGPIALVVMEWAGIWGLIAVKLGFLLVAFGVWWALQTPSRIAIPLAIALTGMGVTAWNSFVIFG